MSVEQRCNDIDGETEVPGEKPVPLPLCSPQIWHWLVWDRDRAHAVTGLSHNTASLTKKINLNYIKTLSPYRAVNTFRLGYKNNQLMLYREIIVVCSEIHTKHINSEPPAAFPWQNWTLLSCWQSCQSTIQNKLTCFIFMATIVTQICINVALLNTANLVVTEECLLCGTT